MDVATSWETAAPHLHLGWPAPPAPVALPEGEVHVWSVALFHPSLDALAGGETLAPDERDRAAKFHFARDRRSYVARRSVLRDILGRYLNLAPAAVRLATAERGKPVLCLTDGAPPLHFNLSHSCGLAVVAVSRSSPVGVDVEKLRPIPEMNDISLTICSPPELVYFNGSAGEARLAAFFRIWTSKEAYLKATGEGITGDLTEMDCGNAPPGWTFRAFAPAPGFTGALAFSGPAGEPRYWRWAAPRGETPVSP